jgi:uncharacterized membrane protein
LDVLLPDSADNIVVHQALLVMGKVIAISEILEIVCAIVHWGVLVVWVFADLATLIVVLNVVKAIMVVCHRSVGDY